MSVDVESILRGVGMQPIRRGNNLMACCPNHPERRPSWGVNINPPYMHGCFSCGYGGILPRMLREKFGWTFSRIKRVFGGNIFKDSKALELAFVNPRAKASSISEVEEEQLYPFALEPKGRKYLEGRGISFQTMKRAGVLFHRKDNRIIFPWRWNGKLVGMTGRACYDLSEDDEKIVAYCGLVKSRVLYVPRGRLPRSCDLVLVEGEIDALKVLQSQDRQPVAALGHGRLSNGQLNLLKTLPVKSLTLFLDNDRRGQELTDEIVFRVANEFPILLVPWEGVAQKDPGEMTEQKIRWMLKNAERKISWPRF